MLRMYETSFEIAPGIAIWFGERHRSLAVLGDQRLAREQMVREVLDNPSDSSIRPRSEAAKQTMGRAAVPPVLDLEHWDQKPSDLSWEGSDTERI